MPTPLLEMRSITKRFGALEVLRGVDLELFAGDVLALLGDNGAGKTTLMKILAGTIPPPRGGICFHGPPGSYLQPGQARAIGNRNAYPEIEAYYSPGATHKHCLRRATTRN